VIVFATGIAESEAFDRYTEPGIRLASEPDSELVAYAAVGSITRSNNILLDAVADRVDLEALVLVHPHAEITDPDLCAKVRAALADPDVAIVGALGATGIRSIAWWEGGLVGAPVTHRYIEHGGGELAEASWGTRGAASGEVDAVGGFLLVLSPWAVRSLRFDESLRHPFGYDVDLCLQARAAGRKVVAADLRVTHHHSLKIVSDLDLWVEAHQQLARKWDGALGPATVGEDAWRERARRAEAEREAARAMTHAHTLASDARILALERELAGVTGTPWWRITAPLRRLNALRAQRRLRAARP
jgi:hypothetical protein